LFFYYLSDENLFPFGFIEGDLIVPHFLDGSSSRIDLGTPFPFFATTEIALYVSSIPKRTHIRRLFIMTAGLMEVKFFRSSYLQWGAPLQSSGV